MRPHPPLAFATMLWLAAQASAFEGRLAAVATQGGQTQTFQYTIGAQELRIERTDTNWPFAQNLVNRETGAITLLFPHNRSFVRLPPPPGIGSQTALSSAAPPGMPPRPAMPAMPMMPMPGEDVGLTATGETTNLLGYACARFEIKQRGEVMEIWATDQLLPFQPWLANQQPHVASRMLEEQWGGLLRDKKQFPLLAVLSYENGAERMRFTVTAIQPQAITDPDGTLFQPPSNYHEIRPLPF